MKYEVITNQSDNNVYISETKWKLCMFCQQVTNENATCSSNITDKSQRQMSYDSLTQNINRFVRHHAKYKINNSRGS